MKSFEEIFENDAKWMTGKILIDQMIENLKGKHPTVRVNNLRMGSVTFKFPDLSDLQKLVPEDLLPIFMKRCDWAMADWFEGQEKELGNFINIKITPQTLGQIDSFLSHIEREELAKNSDRQLWKFFARRMGCPRDRLEHITIERSFNTLQFSDTATAIAGTLDQLHLKE